MKSVLIVGPSIERTKGGVATVIQSQLTNELINKCQRVDYLVSHVEGSLLEKLCYCAKSLFFILSKVHRYDIVHFHSAANASFYRKGMLLRATKFFNVKTVFHIHGCDFDSFYLNSRPILKGFIRSTLLKANVVLVLSEYWRSFFDSEFRQLPVNVLSNGVDVNEFESCKREPKEFCNFLFLGRLCDRKGVYDLITAIDIIVNLKGRKDMFFYLAGDGELDRVHAIVEKLGLQDHVKLLGWLEDDGKKEALKRAEVVVLPSYEENLPMALIEAMSCGKVIISTFAGGIPDLVSNGENGYLLEAGNVHELVEHILFVNGNPGLMSRVSNNNIRLIEKSFNIDVVAEALNAIYSSL